MIAIRMPAEVEARLDRLSKRTGRTKTYYIREAVLEHLSDLEDLYLAEEELRAIRAGAKTYSLEEMKVELGLEN
ncbi:MAG: CopG family transcriptional regulator [Spirochaetes bacterium GWD1_61_31]|nr:MAG: CopG family transcriptional regulator [Spirochaetes bacterium GWB1_60_80]OHD35008.1 MAG: CopG family transcriptional regulator [Spirochaetes bacterium GWC1_61_12]OHD38537.1 MAG: CopG family transcriptional regulator [Spirochaetes bacterium GWD1_61_31]OHD43097.1 MAG: CopG family transcriptional regulator [Spirochaetes bacterium GWE1_60_18]OHD59692.1 MAG: CopG family transcriptional regulator [Spirochaetes bacterium GWF1_60_12]HAP44133.1 CopG family transcriptional regulator [Spirochaeta